MQLTRRAFGAGVVAAALVAEKASAQEKITLNFLHKWPEPDNARYFQAVVKAFETANPNVTIRMEAVADDPYKDKIRVVMASGNIPDIYFSWSGAYAGQFVRAGRAMDLTPAFADQSWNCLLYTSPSPRDGLLSRMPSSA